MVYKTLTQVPQVVLLKILCIFLLCVYMALTRYSVYVKVRSKGYTVWVLVVGLTGWAASLLSH